MTDELEGMLHIDFWIVRKGEDAHNLEWEIAKAIGVEPDYSVDPEVAKALSEHSDNQKCMFCSDGHEIGATIAFRWMRGASIYTAQICANCAKHSNKTLAEMTQQKVFPDRIASIEEHMRRFEKPDGYCLYCRRPANQHHPVGPLLVTIRDGDGNVEKHEFCDWVCLGHWAAEGAGGTLVIERRSC